MLLYHGTSNSNASLIEVTGLKPRRKLKTRGNWTSTYHTPSHQDFVYLATQESSAAFHAIRTALVKGETEATIIKVEVPEENLYPDENALCAEESYVKTIDDMRKGKRRIKKSKDKLKSSLENWQICTHLGAIPANAIVEKKKFDIHNNEYWPIYRGCQTAQDFDKRLNMFIYAQQWRLITWNSHEEFKALLSQIKVEGDFMHFPNGKVVGYLFEARN